MKKILGISVIAAMAVLPMAANAAYTEVSISNSSPNDAEVLATTKYVKGAYNALRAEKYDKADADVPEADTYTAIAADKNVKQNLVALDSAVKALETNVGSTDVANQIKTGAQSGDFTNTATGNNALSSTTIKTAINELATEKQNASDSTVSDQTNVTGTHLIAGTGVGANLESLNTALITAEGDIDTLETNSTVAATDTNNQAITYNYITAGTGVGQNLADLDTAVGKITAAQVSAASHLNASADMATNVAALGAAVKTLETATNGLSTANIATQAGVNNTINALTATQGAVTQGVTGDIATTSGSVTIATDWNNASALDTTTYSFLTDATVEGSTLNTTVSVADPTINKTAYATANASSGS